MIPTHFSIYQLKEIQKRCLRIRGIITNTGWLFADRILRMGVGLFLGVWVARYLGVEQFGTLNYAVAFVGLFSTFANLGLPSLGIRSIIHQPEKKEYILGTTFYLQVVGGVASFLFSVSAIFLLRSNDKVTISIVAILASGAIFQAFDTIDIWFQSQVQSKFTVFAKNTAFIIAAISKVILINIEAPLLAFAALTLGETFLGAVGLIIIYKLQSYSLHLWRWSLPLAKSILKESWPLMLSGFAVMIYVKIDQIMLGEMAGVQAVGLYSSATRISEVWYFIPTSIVSSINPAIYAAKKEGNEYLYYKRIAKLLRILSLIAITIAFPMSFFSGKAITFLFGNDYLAGAPILAIHIWAALFVFMGVGTSCWFIAEGLTHLSFQRTLMGAIVNIFLNFLLIPDYGGVGAAIATVVSYAISGFFAHAIYPKTRGLFWLQIKSLIWCL